MIVQKIAIQIVKRLARFNAGSALAANDLAVSALVVTNLASAATAVSWMLVD